MTNMMEWVRQHGCRHQTTPERAALGLLAGAGAGGAVTILVPAFLTLILAGLAGLRGADDWFDIAAVGAAAGLFVLASLTWGAGLVAVSPIWAGLHHLGVRCEVAASLFGACATASVWAWIGAGFGDGAAAMAVIGGILGAVVGWVVWRVAYRRAA